MQKHEITVFQPDEFEYIEYWVPGHGLEKAREALASGKKVVFLGACDCGCWNRNVHSKKAVQMIREAGLEGKVFHNLTSLSSGCPVVLLPEELRRSEYHVASNLP